MEFIPVPARVSGRSYLDAKAPGVTSCLPPWGSGCRGSGHGCVALNDTPVKRCVRTGQGLPCLLWSHKVNQAQARGKASAASQPAMPVPGHVPYWWTLTCDFTFQLDLNMPYCYGFVWRSLSWQLNQLSITSLELLLLVRCHGTSVRWGHCPMSTLVSPWTPNSPLLGEQLSPAPPWWQPQSDSAGQVNNLTLLIE